MFRKALIDLAERTKAMRNSLVPTENEMIDEEGLICCTVCNERKQLRLKIAIGETEEQEITPFVPCACERAEIAKAQEIEKHKEEERLRNDLRTASMIDARFKDATFTNSKPTESNVEAFEQCKRYAAKFSEFAKESKGLLLYGTVGSGKTYASACIANYLLDSLQSVFIISAADVLKLRTPDEEEALFDKIESVKLLIIDDIGSERATEYGAEKIFNALDCRWRNRKPLVATSNLTVNEMKSPKDKAQARIFDRLIEMCYPIQFTGESWRRREAKSNFGEMKKMLESD